MITLKNILLLFVVIFWSNNLFSQDSVVYSIKINASITPFIAEYVATALEKAKRDNANALLIYLDTPGGLLDSTRTIVQTILASSIPVIVYISPDGARAGSAGVFISLAAHVIAMAPSSNIGAAHPVGLFGHDVEGEMKSKITNDAAAWARSLAQTRGKNADWAEKSVSESASISAQEALKLNVIDLVAGSSQELLAKINNKKINIHDQEKILELSQARIEPIPMSLGQQAMNFLADPNFIYILLMLGLLCILIEFKSPGIFIPGLFGILCLVIVFGVEVLPINWFGALLILIALVFFIAEIFITSFGILAIGGLALLISGSYLLFSVPGSSVFVEPWLIWLLSLGLLAIFFTIGLLLIRAKRQGPTANVDALVGAHAIVKEPIEIHKAGTVLLYGSFWEASAKTPIGVGERVRVIKVVSTKLVVEKISGA